MDKPGAQINVALTGTIGETTPLYLHRLDGVTQLTIDMSKVTYINSIGVKAWIVWTLRIPPKCQVKIVSAPYVIVSQASQTLGFVNDKIKIESMQAPFLCAGCGAEETRVLKQGIDYDYPKDGKPSWTRIPEKSPCSKCRATELEPDFILDKTFKFLEMK